MGHSFSIRHQLNKNLLAIISLVIAVAALSYNSWRNEQSEENRNHRAAGFELMREAAQLQLIVDTATYSLNVSDKDAIKGWVSVNLILSLSQLMTPKIENQALTLKSIWSKNWSVLYEDENANQQITKINTQLVNSVREHLQSLN
jgi:hypothetical protein